MKCRYVNHNGDGIDFLGDLSRVRDGTLHGRDWTASTTSQTIGEIVNYWKRGAIKKDLTITCRGTRKERLSLMDRISDICDADLAENEPGTLWYGEWYCKCFIPTSTVSEGDMPTWINQKMEVYIPSATWWKEDLFRVEKKTASEAAPAYPTPYPFTYGTIADNPIFENDHYTSSDFCLIAYGPASGLNVTISGHQYKVDHEILSGEYMVIDSRDTADEERRCYLVKADGTVVNCYNDRSGELFEKIPKGKMEISYSRQFSIDLILLQGRSEPKWYQ